MCPFGIVATLLTSFRLDAVRTVWVLCWFRYRRSEEDGWFCYFREDAHTQTVAEHTSAVLQWYIEKSNLCVCVLSYNVCEHFNIHFRFHKCKRVSLWACICTDVCNYSEAHIFWLMLHKLISHMAARWDFLNFVDSKNQQSCKVKQINITQHVIYIKVVLVLKLFPAISPFCSRNEQLLMFIENINSGFSSTSMSNSHKMLSNYTARPRERHALYSLFRLNKLVFRKSAVLSFFTFVLFCQHCTCFVLLFDCTEPTWILIVLLIWKKSYCFQIRFQLWLPDMYFSDHPPSPMVNGLRM